MNDPISEIQEFVSAKSKIPVGELDPSTQLLSSGIIRSMVVLELVAHLERKFGIEMDADDLNEDNFKDIATLGGLVSRVIDGAGARAAL